MIDKTTNKTETVYQEIYREQKYFVNIFVIMAGVVAAKLKLKKQQEAEEEAKVNDLDLSHTFAQHKHSNCTQDNIENNNDQVEEANETVSDQNFQVVTLTLSPLKQFHTKSKFFRHTL